MQFFMQPSLLRWYIYLLEVQSDLIPHELITNHSNRKNSILPTTKPALLSSLALTTLGFAFFWSPTLLCSDELTTPYSKFRTGRTAPAVLFVSIEQQEVDFHQISYSSTIDYKDKTPYLIAQEAHSSDSCLHISLALMRVAQYDLSLSCWSHKWLWRLLWLCTYF